VGPRTGMDACGKPRPYWDSIPGSSSPQSVGISTTLFWPTFCSWKVKDKSYSKEDIREKAYEHLLCHHQQLIHQVQRIRFGLE